MDSDQGPDFVTVSHPMSVTNGEKFRSQFDFGGFFTDAFCDPSDNNNQVAVLG